MTRWSRHETAGSDQRRENASRQSHRVKTSHGEMLDRVSLFGVGWLPYYLVSAGGASIEVAAFGEQ